VIVDCLTPAITTVTGWPYGSRTDRTTGERVLLPWEKEEFNEKEKEEGKREKGKKRKKKEEEEYEKGGDE